MARSLLVGTAAFVLGACLAPGDHKKETADSAWLADAQRQIAAREYRASENGEGLQAPNRAHNLRTYFESTGIRVHDRTAAGSPQLLQLTLARLGRGETLGAIEPGGAPVTNENRVEIPRPALIEWYVNSPEGLEQGVTLAKRPPGDGPIAIELAIGGARPELRGNEIVFESGSRKLRYGELVAKDADGATLVARFEVTSADRVRIVVDDAGATYPVAIDPLLTETADAQLESNQGTSEFGAVAGAGDVNGDGYADVIVGASRYDNGQTDEGAAFLFRGSASGIASANPSSPGVQMLESNLQDGVLGYSVAGAGDVNGDGYADVIVGAPYYNSGQGVFEGAAFVFLGSASGLTTTSPGLGTAQLEGNQASGQFGKSVAGAGDVNGDGYADVIVGTDSYNAGLSFEGAAFVFHGGISGIANGNPSTADAQLESNQSDVSYAFAVAGAGDVNADGYGDVIVGAYRYAAGETNEGAAFVYKGSSTGIADSINPLTPDVVRLESNQSSALLGYSVAGAGDVDGDGYGDVIVGARDYNAGQVAEGAAFVLRGSSGIANSNPATPGVRRLESNQANAVLGASVAGAGDVNGDGYADVIVGASSYDATPNDEGAAFVFLGSSSGIANGNPTTAFAQLESNQANSLFGGLRGLAGAGDVNGDGYADVIVGASSYDATPNDEGAAFVYLGGSSGIADGSPATAAAQFEADQASALLGSSVSGAGDVNGDGYGDVIVGAREYDAGQTDEGAAFIFLGSASGLADGNPSLAATQLEANQANAGFGFSVAGAGDVNGDGYGDVVVGSWLYDSGTSEEGAAFVFHGTATGIADGDPATAATQLESNQDAAVFGFSVAGAGDVNGDGYSDLIVGAPSYSAGQDVEGAAFVFRGSASGVADSNPATPGVTRLESDQVNSLFGASVAGAGDADGDGYADVVVGAPYYDAGFSDTGAAYVFRGTASGIANGTPATAATQLASEDNTGYFGASVAAAGDTNGDGYSDVIIGHPGVINGSSEGAAFVFEGGPGGIPSGISEAVAAAWIESDQPLAGVAGPPASGHDVLFGVSGAGDVNGDGYSDVIVGFSYYDAGQTNEGAAFVFLGGASGIANGNLTTAAAQLESNQANAYFGFSVASAGDVNGDGFADVIVGSARGTHSHSSTVTGGYDNGQGDEGAAFVFLGNSQGRPVRAHQERGNGSGIPVQPWGLANSTTGFAVELAASHPQGTGRVKAQIEACPAGVVFGNGSCTTLLTPSWITVNGSTPEVVLSETFSGLTNNALYHWRARILHVTRTGTIPASPAHGPWRRVGAQSVEADIRLPEPGLLLCLASGLALVAVLARGRRPASRFPRGPYL